jgi:hypothetical protein
MVTRFEVVLMHDDTFFFQLRTADGEVVLRSLGSPSKVMTQNELLHLRTAIKEDPQWIQHQTKDGASFFIIKDKDGSVLAKTIHTKTHAELNALKETALEARAAPMIDMCKKARAHAN